jgi:hypothetical protein
MQKVGDEVCIGACITQSYMEKLRQIMIPNKVFLTRLGIRIVQPQGLYAD